MTKFGVEAGLVDGGGPTRGRSCGWDRREGGRSGFVGADDTSAFFGPVVVPFATAIGLDGMIRLRRLGPELVLGILLDVDVLGVGRNA